MKTRLLPADAPGAVEEAATALANGELVAFPTDTVYGLAAGHDHLRKLYVAKDRPKDKRIPILLSEAGNLEASAMVTPADWWCFSTGKLINLFTFLVTTRAM